MTLGRPTGLFGWVRSNNSRSITYFLAFAIAAQILAATLLFVPLALLDEAHSPLFGTVGYLTFYAPLIFCGTLIVFVAQMMLYAANVQKAAGFTFVDASDEPRLCAITEKLLATAGMNAPFIAVLESRAMNAFACGVSQSKSILVVTRGLLEGLNDVELESVLAHELTHIKNNDTRLMAAANICVANLRQIHKWNPLHFRNAIHGLICIGFPVFFPLMIIGGLVGQLAIRGAYGSRLIISSSREFIADAEAVRLTQSPAALASALFKVKGRHRIKTMHAEDEAMMIAGDSDGPTASHPLIDERVDALSRTTGSMVFNAPGAHKEAQRDRFAKQAASGNSDDRPLSAFSRVGQVTGENIFGLTQTAKWTLFIAIALSMAWQGTSLLSPTAVASKMDVRQFGDYLGVDQLHCPFDDDTERCFNQYQADYSEFGDQQGTLLGFMVQRGERARAEKRAKGEEIARSAKVRMLEFEGQSGRMSGQEFMMTADGKFFDEDAARLRKAISDEAKLAEVRQIGCFHEYLFHGDNTVAEFSITDPDDGADFREYAKELGDAARLALGNGDRELIEYTKTRRDIMRIAFDLFGLEGLAAIQGVLAAQTHKSVEAKLADRLLDPDFAIGTSSIERAELAAIARKPNHYVPCLALRHLPIGDAKTRPAIFGTYSPTR